MGVHPAHARKMAAKLQAEVPLASDNTFFYESTEGGHSSALPKQSAYRITLEYAFLAKELGLQDTSSTSEVVPQSTDAPSLLSASRCSFRLSFFLSGICPLLACWTRF